MKVGDMVGHPSSGYQYEADPKNWLAPKLRIGLELEIENPKGARYVQEDYAPHWVHERDGSLRDNGFELVLAQPMFGQDLDIAVSKAAAFVAKYPFVYNYRTGLHVHVDTRNMEVDELKRLFVIYALFEQSIFSFVGDDRTANNFCAPWYRISDHLDSVFTIFKDDVDRQSARNVLKSVERYSALNCNALEKYGSIEFRHLQMSGDFAKIRNWINLIMSIYNAATGTQWGPTALTHDKFVAFIAKGGAMDMARSIFPEWFLGLVDDRAIWEGIFLVQAISTDMEQKYRFDRPAPVGAVYPLSDGINPAYQSFIDKARKELA
jgi:hypothetical protein